MGGGGGGSENCQIGFKEIAHINKFKTQFLTNISEYSYLFFYNIQIPKILAMVATEWLKALCNISQLISIWHA